MNKTEDAHHIFVVCPYLADVCAAHQAQISLSTVELLLEAPFGHALKQRLQAMADSMFTDSPC